MILDFSPYKKNALNNVIIRYKPQKRGQIFLGFKCDQHCKFCFYNNISDNKNFSANDIIRQIDLEIQTGSTVFEIMGGEPSICDDIIEYIKYIKSKNKNFKINIITNGSIYLKPEIIQLSDIITLSYHLSTKNNAYDKTIFPDNCTFNKAYLTSKLCHQYNKFLKIHCVFGYYNIEDLNLIANDLILFNPKLINFFPVDLENNLLKQHNKYDYVHLTTLLKKNIDLLSLKLPKSSVYIKYIPFCHMEGYEQHIIGQFQRFFDYFDFSKELSVPIIKNLLLYDDATILKTFNERNNLQNRFLQDFIKTNKCLKCKNLLICNGFDIQYFNEEYVKPTSGKIIHNPMEYIKNNINDLYQQLH